MELRRLGDKPLLQIPNLLNRSNFDILDFGKC